ncbi:hypothetical protein GOODEAATRI_024339 [Goodea atripinnis]|uniref:Uncharacterized protein n=1 Tax=Goodea atripinnis TaxID=208336 RepID=A0ABV0NMV8_9TELE
MFDPLLGPAQVGKGDCCPIAKIQLDVGPQRVSLKHSKTELSLLSICGASRVYSLYEPPWDSLICMKVMLTHLPKMSLFVPASLRGLSRSKHIAACSLEAGAFLPVPSDSATVEANRDLETRGKRLLRC